MSFPPFKHPSTTTTLSIHKIQFKIFSSHLHNSKLHNPQKSFKVFRMWYNIRIKMLLICWLYDFSSSSQYLNPLTAISSLVRFFKFLFHRIQFLIIWRCVSHNLKLIYTQSCMCVFLQLCEFLNFKITKTSPEFTYFIYFMHIYIYSHKIILNVNMKKQQHTDMDEWRQKIKHNPYNVGRRRRRTKTTLNQIFLTNLASRNEKITNKTTTVSFIVRFCYEA